MTNAREAVLQSIRDAVKVKAHEHGGEQPLSEWTTSARRHTRPIFVEDLVERMQRKLEGAAASVEHLECLEELPVAVAGYLARRALPDRVACAPALRALPWRNDLPDLRVGRARRDDLVSVTPCIAGVAETGSLIFTSAPDTPTTLNFVPEHHLAVLHCETIVAHVEDAWERLRRRNADNGGMPRAVNIISGPSRTADIEQTLQLGAHGPRRLHVFFVRAGTTHGK